jgi:hypothetical protein
MFSRRYVVINQLIKSIWKATHFKNSLLYMLRGEKIQSNKKWPRFGTFENMAQIWSFKNP